MKPAILFLFILIAIVLIEACNKPATLSPITAIEQMDSVYNTIAPPAQQFIISSTKASKIEGAEGTIIHLDPKNLETIDGSPLGQTIQVELLEITNKSSLLLQNASTTAGNQILVSGGAYYLNMTSEGKQLRIIEGKEVEVEFPKLTNNEMELFIGQRDSLGQLDWKATSQKFKSKTLKKPIAPSSQQTIEVDGQNEIEQILGYIGDGYDTLSKERIEAYQRKKKAYEKALETYEAIQLTNFGWINCDRFLEDPNPKTDIQLAIKNDSLSFARVHAIFEDINSIMTEYYFSANKEVSRFRNIPINRKITILAISMKNNQTFIADTTIITKEDQIVAFSFQATTTAALQKRIKEMN